MWREREGTLNKVSLSFMCSLLWDKKTIDVKEEMAGLFSVTIRCSFVGGDHQWVVTELYGPKIML